MNVNSTIRRLQHDPKLAKKISNAKAMGHSPTKSKATSMLVREEMRGKRNRLKCFLLQQMKQKYGTKNSESPVNRYIESSVDSLLLEVSEIDDRVIAALERDIRQKVAELRQKAREMVSARTMEQEQQEEERVRTAESEKSLPPRRDPRDSLDPKQWVVLNAIISAEGEERTAAEQAAARKKKADYKKILDDHQSLYDKNKASEAARSRKMLEIQRKHESDFNAREDAKSSDRGSKIMTERNIRLGQIEDRQLRRAEEARKKRQEEDGEIARAKMLLQEEADKVDARKRFLAKQQEELIAENEKFKAIKDEIRRKEQLEIVRLQEEAKARQIKEDKRRADEFNDRMERQARLQKGYSTGAGAKMEANRLEEERRTLADIEKKFAADDLRERTKIENRKLRMQEDMKANEAIIARKAKEKEDERMRNVALRERYKKETAEEAAEKFTKAEMHNKKMAQARLMLDDQVRLQRQKFSDEGALSSLEAGLNKSLIQRLEKDDVARKVLAKVKPEQEYVSKGFMFA
jgi:hypothetical protein